MPRLNINSLFAEKRKVTVPPVKIPRNVRQALCIDQARENGIFRLEPQSGDALYDRCYIFEDINYITLDKDRKESVLLILMSLFKSMDGQFKITVASDQQDMDKFMSQVFDPIHGDKYPVVEQGIGQWINQKIAEGTRDISRILLLTVTCRAAGFAEAAGYFMTLDTVLSNIFRNLRSRLYALGGMERLLLLQRMLRAGLPQIPVEQITEDGAWKNQILPEDIEQDTDYLIINGKKYACVLFGHDYGQTLNEEKMIHALSDVPFPTYVTVDMQRVPKKLVKDKLLTTHMNNERLISQERSRNFNNKQFGAGTSYSLGKKKEELEEAMDQVDENDEEGLFLGLLVYVWADSLEELTERTDMLQEKAKGCNYTLEPYLHRQLKALNTVLPIGGRQVNHMRFLYTSSAVAFQPFYASDLQERGKGAIVYGLNPTTKQLLRGNRKKLLAPHGFIVAHTGSGKSFLIKETEIAQTLLFTDDDIIILDPNNEQEVFIRALSGAQYIDLTPQSPVHMNPFEIPSYIAADDVVAQNKFVASMAEYASSFCAAVMTNMVVTQVHINQITKAVRAMYRDYFGGKLKRREVPTMILFREYLRRQKDAAEFEDTARMIQDIVDSLEEFTEGVYDMFAHESDIDMESRLIGFGLKNIPESVWEPAMLTIMHYLRMRINANQSDRVALRLIVDEAQVLCEKPTTAEQLLYAVETYRKVGAVVTLAAQNLTHVLENPRMRDMFSNCPYKCFMDMGGLDAANLAKIQELSTTEYRTLEENRKGYGVMVWGGQVFLFDAMMDEQNVLYEYFNTDFHEKAERAQVMKQDEGQDKE